jgi:hypothetical protein
LRALEAAAGVPPGGVQPPRRRRAALIGSFALSDGNERREKEKGKRQKEYQYGSTRSAYHALFLFPFSLAPIT